MAILTVTSKADSGAGSLRETISKAQAGDTIIFASSLANQTITLSSNNGKGGALAMYRWNWDKYTFGITPLEWIKSSLGLIR